jgi:hypothetical protein
MRKPWMIFGVLALSLASTSCLRPQKNPPRAFTPPPTKIWGAVPNTIPTLPQAPPIAPDEASVAPPQLPDMTPETFPEVPEAPKRVTTHRATPPVVAPKPPAIATPAESPPAPPRLAQLYTAEEQREHARTLDETMERVNRSLASIEGKNLTQEQKEQVERIRTYQKQAEQAREQDLLTAVSLARRADLLAKDLLERLP